jgi:hypothetical protein
MPLHAKQSKINEQLLRLTEISRELRDRSIALKKKLSEASNFQTIVDAKEFNHFKNDFQQRSSDIQTIINELKPTQTFHNDTIDKIKNRWSDIQRDESVFENLSSSDHHIIDKMKQNISDIKDSLCNICNQCYYFTIPFRLNEILNNKRIGEGLNFYNDFLEDDFCSETEAKTFFKWLSIQPKIISGVIDAENGMIYKSSDDQRRQWLSYVVSFILIGIGAIAVFFLTPSIAQIIPDFPLNTLTSLTFLIPYMFIIFGGIIHILIGIIKENKYNTNTSRKAFTSWFLWGHINEMSLWTGIIMLWMGFVGLLWLKQYDWFSALATGYSIDSVYDVFVGRFEKAVSTKIDAEKNLIKS